MATHGSGGVPRRRAAGTAPCRLGPETHGLPLELVGSSSRCRAHPAASWRRARYRGGAPAMTKQRRAVGRRVRSHDGDSLPQLQRDTFRYFWRETNPANGLISDNTAAPDVPASIAGV